MATQQINEMQGGAFCVCLKRELESAVSVIENGVSLPICAFAMDDSEYI